MSGIDASVCLFPHTSRPCRGHFAVLFDVQRRSGQRQWIGDISIAVFPEWHS
jgi:hypothetical protein